MIYMYCSLFPPRHPQRPAVLSDDRGAPAAAAPRGRRRPGPGSDSASAYACTFRYAYIDVAWDRTVSPAAPPARRPRRRPSRARTTLTRSLAAMHACSAVRASPSLLDSPVVLAAHCPPMWRLVPLLVVGVSAKARSMESAASAAETVRSSSGGCTLRPGATCLVDRPGPHACTAAGGACDRCLPYFSGGRYNAGVSRGGCACLCHGLGYSVAGVENG